MARRFRFRPYSSVGSARLDSNASNTPSLTHARSLPACSRTFLASESCGSARNCDTSFLPAVAKLLALSVSGSACTSLVRSNAISNDDLILKTAPLLLATVSSARAAQRPSAVH